MIEVKNKIYTQRFFAKKISSSDLFKAVTYTQYEGDEKTIPCWYKRINGETSTIDLTQTAEELYGAIKSNTRNEIKRAQKEGCTFDYNYDYESFVPFYNDFCESKGLNDSINVHTLAKYNKTLITRVLSSEGVVLAMHATVINDQDKEAMLLYSCSKRLSEGVDRKLIGWGNRYLHWAEIEYFKSIGMKRYEWNGVCTDPEQTAVYNISQFKLAFGGGAKNTIGLRTPLFVFLKSIQKMLKKG